MDSGKELKSLLILSSVVWIFCLNVVFSILMVHSQQHAQRSPHSQYKYLSTQVIWTKLGLKNSQGCLLMLNTQRICFHQWESNSYCMVTRCSLSSIGNRIELVLQTMEACSCISFDSTWKAQTKKKKSYWLKSTRITEKSTYKGKYEDYNMAIA